MPRRKLSYTADSKAKDHDNRELCARRRARERIIGQRNRFRAMALTPVYGEVDDAASLATLHRTVDLGMTFIDTANIYGGGDNERLIAKLLADRRDEVTLATKIGISGNPADRAAGRIGVRGDAAYVRQCIDESLQRLKTDVVDLYYMHRRDVNVPIEETVGAMAELVAAGKVRHLGLSRSPPTSCRPP